MFDARLPTYLWLEAKMRELLADGVGVYVVQRGEKMDGQVLLKLSSTKGQAKILTRQRNLHNEFEWVNVLDSAVMEEQKADAYIQRAKQRDPDLWIIEIESPSLNNPFLL